ncbi:MAG: 2,3-bisphosphoglycerate-independent phosphoglycerate mutase [Patescibacteria group bacterium]|nr:2,3-bisphosphoglycerate-independent phosphoglycerate mutase [Patescibacteria group bacterium]
MVKNPVLLLILDGWGIAPPSPGNAITQSKIPYYKKLQASYPNTRLYASGQAVGLPRGEDGNSEVGHTNIGAGHIVFQALPRINTSIADGSFFNNPAFIKAINHAKKNQSTLHLMGLIGSGGVHANNEHLFALIKLCLESNLHKLSLHLFTDGRDSPPNTSASYIDQINQHLSKSSVGQIASICGRYYAMDRDFRWQRTKKTYDCLTLGIGLKAQTAKQAIEKSYQNQKTDEFIEPTNIVDSKGVPLSLIKDNDAVIFYNFRVDRPRQLTKAFVLKDFETKANQLAFDPLSDKYLKSHLPEKASTTPIFKRQKVVKNLFFTTMTEYEKNLNTEVAFEPIYVNNPLSRVISQHNLSQLHLTETEKERFVTYYFNGLREQPFLKEDWEIIPSPKVATYNLKPEMSTPELTTTLIEKLKLKKYDFILLNFPCPDMVGHTGDLQASIKACEVIDHALEKIIPVTLALNYTTLITADHGNIEELINLKTGEIDTEHSNNQVPLFVISNQLIGKQRGLQSGILADIAPTILKILGIPQPTSMTGKNLLQ